MVRDERFGRLNTRFHRSPPPRCQLPPARSRPITPTMRRSQVSDPRIVMIEVPRLARKDQIAASSARSAATLNYRIQRRARVPMLRVVPTPPASRRVTKRHFAPYATCAGIFHWRGVSERSACPLLALPPGLGTVRQRCCPVFGHAAAGHPCFVASASDDISNETGRPCVAVVPSVAWAGSCCDRRCVECIPQFVRDEHFSTELRLDECFTRLDALMVDPCW